MENPGGLVNDAKCTSLKPPLWLKEYGGSNMFIKISPEHIVNILNTEHEPHTIHMLFGRRTNCAVARHCAIHRLQPTTIPHQPYNYCIHLIRYTYNIIYISIILYYIILIPTYSNTSDKSHVMYVR